MLIILPLFDCLSCLCLCDPVEYVLSYSACKENTSISHLCNDFISKDDLFVALMLMQQC